MKIKSRAVQAAPPLRKDRLPLQLTKKVGCLCSSRGARRRIPKFIQWEGTFGKKYSSRTVFHKANTKNRLAHLDFWYFYYGKGSYYRGKVPKNIRRMSFLVNAAYEMRRNPAFFTKTIEQDLGFW
jgi:hypothetical protein